jgi:hypothetical protein
MKPASIKISSGRKFIEIPQMDELAWLLLLLQLSLHVPDTGALTTANSQVFMRHII